MCAWEMSSGASNVGHLEKERKNSCSPNTLICSSIFMFILRFRSSQDHPPGGQKLSLSRTWVPIWKAFLTKFGSAWAMNIFCVAYLLADPPCRFLKLLLQLKQACEQTLGCQTDILILNRFWSEKQPLVHQIFFTNFALLAACIWVFLCRNEPRVILPLAF